MKGFTLFELVISLTLVIALSTGAVLLVRDVRPSFELRDTVQNFQNDIQNARIRSITEQQSYGIEFDEWQQRYYLVRGTTRINTYYLPDNYYFSDGLPFTIDILSFDSLGAASASGTIVIEYTSGKKKTITISPAGFSSID